MKVAIQGLEASFHHQAAKKFFGQDVQIVACNTFKEAFNQLLNQKVDKAVIAVENSLYGTINPVYDLLLKKRPWICGEIYLRIEHCLIGIPGSNKKHISEIYSQIMALAQCENYLEKNFSDAKHIEHHDTVASVELVKNLKDKTKAAIASRQAAKLYKMSILEENVEDNKQNFTRFVVLDSSKTKDLKATKTSLVLKTAHRPGALHDALGVFKDNEINLTKLQSRPIPGQAWRYMFYVDIEIGVSNTRFNKALDSLEKQDCDTIILGSYLAADK